MSNRDGSVCKRDGLFHGHPVLLDAYREGVTIQLDRLRLSSSKQPRGLTAEEWAVVNLLDMRAKRAKVA
jgi:hypothetical protein